MKLCTCLFLALTMSAFAGPRALNELVYELRNPQTDSVHFRQTLETIGEHLAYDVLEEMAAKEVSIQTLTGAEVTHLLTEEVPVLVTILRAGLPLNAGVHKVFSNAEVGFLGMSRNEKTLKADVDYIALPDVRDRSVIISDTMLATGGSMVDAIRLIEKRSPRRIFVIAAIASQPGIEKVTKHNPSIKVFAAAIDPSLNEQGYIIPGLGDAGDRSYGSKHHSP